MTKDKKKIDDIFGLAEDKKELKEISSSSIDLDGLKKKASSADNTYRSFKFRESVLLRAEQYAKDNDIRYTGQLIHAIIEAFLEKEGY